ncbi:MAG: hypothetical protein ACYSXF_05770 [Planctomycetota bacterium]|jgi:hypothetical protein
MPEPKRKSLMHNLGEFVGHIVKAVKTDPSKKVVKKTVEEEDRGDVVLRRTTIEEVEIKERERNDTSSRSEDTEAPPP